MSNGCERCNKPIPITEEGLYPLEWLHSDGTVELCELCKRCYLIVCEGLDDVDREPCTRSLPSVKGDKA